MAEFSRNNLSSFQTLFSLGLNCAHIQQYMARHSNQSSGYYSTSEEKGNGTLLEI